MGWLGEVQDALETSAADIDNRTKHSLGWLLAVRNWNDWAQEAVSSGNLWEYTGIPEADYPKNCEWDKEHSEDIGSPMIQIPNYDMNQILTEETNNG